MTGDELHDWELQKIEIEDEQRRLSLEFRSPDLKRCAVLAAFNVQAFKISDLSLQNVVLDFVIFRKNMKSDELEYCQRLLDLDSGPIDDNMQLVFIEPSVGAEIAFYCERFQIDELTA